MKYANLPPDKQIGQYVWNHQAHLGSGAFGKVYLGRDSKKNEQVAIKVMENQQIQDPYMQEALKNEIKILSMLKGPNVVGLLDFLQTKNRTYIIQMFCNQGDFRSYLTKKGKLKEPEAKKVLQDLLKGMQELVSHELVHRDLKPENILVHDNVFKVADFGFGKYVGDMSKAMLKTCCGTPLYMSPQILMQQQYTPKSDVWSMGLIYYEMLFGKTPWPCRSQIDLVNNIKKMPIQFPYGEPISEESKNFIKKCLAIEEKNRYSWVQVFADQIFIKKDNELHYEKKRSVDSNDKKLLKHIQDIVNQKHQDIQELFYQIDISHTGSLNQQEFTKFIQKIEPNFNSLDIQQIFKKLDINNDNKLSLNEFQDLILGTDYSDQHGNDMLNDYRANKLLKKLVDIINDNQINIERIFKKFDASGDNQLDIQEFGKILRVIDNTILDQEIQFIFQKFDADHSGTLTLQEFKKALQLGIQVNESPSEPNSAQISKNVPPEALQVIIELKNIIRVHKLDLNRIFANFDQDKSGTLDFQEFLKMVQTINQRIPENAIKALFNSVDLDHSGTLQFQEFAKMLI